MIGPDLDSYWICYHNYEIDIQGRHTRRNANLDRMLFNNEKLMVSGPTRHVVEAPHLPDFFGWADDSAFERAFVRWGDGVQLNGTLGESFTAEVCLGSRRARRGLLGLCGRGQHGGRGADRLCHRPVPDRKRPKMILAQKALFDGFNACAMHTLRLAVPARPDQRAGGHNDAVCRRRRGRAMRKARRARCGTGELHGVYPSCGPAKRF